MKIRSEVLSSYQYGQRQFYIFCPHCDRPFSYGSYFIRMTINGVPYLVTEILSHCGRSFNMPIAFDFRLKAKQCIERMMRDIRQSKHNRFPKMKLEEALEAMGVKP